FWTRERKYFPRQLILRSRLPPSCKATTASDNYLKARRSVKLRIEDLTKFVEDGSRSITNNLKSHLENSKAARAAQLEKLSQRTTRKLDELTSLDVSYGCWMRNETMLLNDEIRRSFDALERAVVPNVGQIMSMLKDLQSEVSKCAECADKNVTSCREHVVPTEFAKCVDERLDEATLMLNRVSKEARLKLAEIVKFRETVIKAHEMTAEEVMELNHRKSAELSKYLERCIVKLKKANK
ncbi:hypothetical protein X777_01829, partial [Ooceraea biroi]